MIARAGYEIRFLFAMTGSVVHTTRRMKNAKSPCLWEMGYKGVDRDDLAEWLEKHPDAIVIDVRYGFIPPAAPWSQHALRTALGDRYRHYRSLGNKNYKSGGPIELSDAQRGVRALRRLLDEGWEPVLMCACKEYEGCHRTEVVRELEKTAKFKLRSVFGKRQQGLF